MIAGNITKAKVEKQARRFKDAYEVRNAHEMTAAAKALHAIVFDLMLDGQLTWANQIAEMVRWMTADISAVVNGFRNPGETLLSETAWRVNAAISRY